MGRAVTSAAVPVLIGLATLAARDVGAQAPVPVGGEFLVNTYTSGEQYRSAVGVDADGDFVIAWHDPQDGSGYGVFARRFSAAGLALGAVFQVNTYTTGVQSSARIASDSDGDFAIVWNSLGQDGSSYGVFARRFSSAGTPLTAEIPVNSTTANAQGAPDVAGDPDGDFVVVWESNLQDGSAFGIFARRFSSAGAPLGGEFRANSFTSNAQRAPAIDAEGDGDFVVVWVSLGQDGSAYGVFGQRFSSAGAPLGPEFQINSTFTDDQTAPSVGVDADGDFVVAWQHEVGALGNDVLIRRFNSTGAPQGGELPASADPASGGQLAPQVAADADGDFIVAWSGAGAGSADDNGIFMRRFKASGVAQNLDTQVNTNTSGPRADPAVAADPDGDFVVAWEAIDGAGFGVFAQRFDVSPLVDVDGDGLYLPLTDGLLLLRFSFGFTGATLITGAVSGSCTRCDAPSITAYLQSLI
jgi:hypothetical protein